MTSHRIVFWLNAAAAALALVVLWEAEVRAYWVWPVSIDDAAVQRAKSEPPQAVLQAISQQRLGLPGSYENVPVVDRAEAVRKAERILSGTVEFHRSPSAQIAVPFERANFTIGRVSHQLFIAALVPVDLLLQAYRLSGDERFLRAALDEIIAFERVDRFSLIPSGLQWNDHTMSNTISILAELWSYVRHRSDLDAGSATAILSLVARTGERLAKPGFFTYRTNHGVMQNIALLQISAAFPSLKSARALGELGCSRLKEQMAYYVSPEGIVLEHSAGYHEFGRELIGFAAQLTTLGDCKETVAWQAQLERVRAYSGLLWRPDRTLPVYGNTDANNRLPDQETTVPTRPARAVSLFPISGYSVWWSGIESWPQLDRLSQTIVTWSNFPSKAHKHADDLSVLIWSRGVSWLGSVGYWPYDAAGYSDAQGWDGANAPHFVGEPYQAIPVARLLGSAGTDRLRALALERGDASGRARLRRQIVELDGSTWLIADSVSGARADKIRRTFTTSPAVESARANGSEVILKAKGSALAARLTFLGPLSATPQIAYGQSDPSFIGWNVVDAKPRAVPAVSIEQDGPSALLISVVQVDDEQRLRTLARPSLHPAANADSWTATVPTRDGAATVSWSGDHVSASVGSATIAATLASENPSEARAQIVSAYSAMGKRYTRIRELTHYRYRLTGWFFGLFALQELTAFALRQRVRAAVVPFRLLASLLWPLLAAYCAYAYLG
jgi:hypothetical protein